VEEVNVGDPLQFFHRSNGQPVYDSDGAPMTVPAEGVPMVAVITAVRNVDTVDLKVTDAAGQERREEYVYILNADDSQPRGGRYALRMDDAVLKHRRATRYGR
jgi:hypothetical protein